jgi:hypothetical protein
MVVKFKLFDSYGPILCILPMSHKSINFLLFIFLISFDVFDGVFANAATRLEGFVSHESFSGDRVTSGYYERFCVDLDDHHWIAITEFIGIYPTNIEPSRISWPRFQEVGSDGYDLYFKRVMQIDETEHGWIEPGVVPNQEQSGSISLLWFTYGSSDFFKTKPNALRPSWGVGDMNDIRLDKCQQKVIYSMSTLNPDYLDNLCYLSDGRRDPMKPKEAPRNAYEEPFSNGFTQAVFRVNEFTDQSIV